MGRYFPFKFHYLRILIHFYGLLLSLTFCQDLLASQSAIIMVDRAVIYADEQMSAPVGFVRKGKKVKVGEISRNRAQVYPVIISGKIAYIRVLDVSTEKESLNSSVLVAERFQQSTVDEHKSNYSVSLFNYATQINLDVENDDLKNKDPVNWVGISVRGGAQISPVWDLDILFNFMSANAENEVFKTVELGLGAAARIYDKKRFKLRLLMQLLAVPFASYSLGDEFRVNGYGFSTGAGLSATYRLGKNFGIEGYGGFYYTKLSGFSAPGVYSSINPSFIGTRLGLGLNYQF